jgi:hypothetical protein
VLPIELAASVWLPGTPTSRDARNTLSMKMLEEHSVGDVETLCHQRSRSGPVCTTPEPSEPVRLEDVSAKPASMSYARCGTLISPGVALSCGTNETGRVDARRYTADLNIFWKTTEEDAALPTVESYDLTAAQFVPQGVDELAVLPLQYKSMTLPSSQIY